MNASWLIVLVVAGVVLWQPAAEAARPAGRGLFALSQSVNATNWPDAPAQLLAIDEKTGVITIIGPVQQEDTAATPLRFNSVTGWPFYAGGVAVEGFTFAVLERPDGTPVLATIDLTTGRAIKTLPLVDVAAIFGLIMIAGVDGVPYGSVLRYKRTGSSIEVGPFLPNGSVASQVSFRHSALVSRGIAGGGYLAFLQQDTNHQLVDLESGLVRDVLGRSCWYKNQWVGVQVAPQRESVGFVDPNTGHPHVLISHQSPDGQSYLVSLARLNDTDPSPTSFCTIEWMSEPISVDVNKLVPSGDTGFDPTTNQFHTLLLTSTGLWQYEMRFLASVNVTSGEVRQTQLHWPSGFKGGVRQMVYHLP